ncbi:Tetratricopeptide-like helical domain containing protein [Parasponia andersonii]|uniref:Tetratricopeptide-like helical domain containing protein n=1 Tax=Parasponia andersonii TaxID=3476 RepID=A0A2P5E3U0_PARAD|nr:Tetratricopeptide-like helical domain containing protein [Parasponia andersonii]
MRIRCGVLGSLRQNSNTQFRYLTIEAKEPDFTQVAMEVSKITRTRPRWEHTLMSEYPSFDFSDPRFFRELLKHQNNAFLSLRFFTWVSSNPGFSPDSISCNALFGSLVEAKACNAAKFFLKRTGFSPEPGSLECYIRCLCENGLVEEALDVFAKLKGDGVCLSTMTWNKALMGCLRIKRTDLFWQIYQQMMESGVRTDVETVGYLIRAFCDENQVFKAYELVRQVSEDGLAPENASFNRLLSGFSKNEDYDRLSEVLHMMIAINRNPDVYSYQEVINGLCKNRKVFEGFRVFNDLKDRGYFPDRVMYTTMIHGFCSMGSIGEARKLWFEMIQKGYLPNEYTYSTLLHTFSGRGYYWRARKLYKEMRDKGYGDTVVSYNIMSKLLCNARLEEMAQKGVASDLKIYNCLIRGFCEKGYISKSIRLLNQLFALGLQPSSSSYTLLIKKLCRVGDKKEAKKLLYWLLAKGLQPSSSLYTPPIKKLLIKRLCQVGNMKAAKKLWDGMMAQKGVAPDLNTYNCLIRGFCKKGKIEQSIKLLNQLLAKGLLPSSSFYTLPIEKLCQMGDMKAAKKLWDEMMAQKGVAPDLNTYNCLIRGFCKKGKIEESIELLNQLLAKGLQPSSSSYTPLIEKLCQVGDMKAAKKLSNLLLAKGLQPSSSFYTSLIEKLCQVGDMKAAKKLWDEMTNVGLEPMIYTCDMFVIGYCDIGDLAEGMEWLVMMLKNQLKPKEQTFLRLLESFSGRDRLVDSLLIVDYMFKTGYKLQRGMLGLLVYKLCQRNPPFVGKYLEEILERT